MPKSHSQVLPGGIFACPVPFGAPGLVSGGRSPPAGAESLLRRVCCPVEFIVPSSGDPCLNNRGRSWQYCLTTITYRISQQVHSSAFSPDLARSLDWHRTRTRAHRTTTVRQRRRPPGLSAILKRRVNFLQNADFSGSRGRPKIVREL